MTKSTPNPKDTLPKPAESRFDQSRSAAGHTGPMMLWRIGGFGQMFVYCNVCFSMMGFMMLCPFMLIQVDFFACKILIVGRKNVQLKFPEKKMMFWPVNTFKSSWFSGFGPLTLQKPVDDLGDQLPDRKKVEMLDTRPI